jgi:muramoyltetrapeptide carboxypeptidase
LDYDLIKRNPKILCGFSDITALANAIYAKTGLVTYSGPHYTYFGDKLGVDYTFKYFRKCLLESASFNVLPSQRWSDDKWSNSQDDRIFAANAGYRIINEGEAEGKIIGGNLCTLNLLQGTRYMPDIRDSILFIEDDHMSSPETFDRDLQSLMHQPKFSSVRGLVIGRFQLESKMSDDVLMKILKGKPKFEGIPVIANADFGHTTPMITFPIGGTARIRARGDDVSIQIMEH